ncbi:hypothetical protein [Hahella sp. CR1]|uniref:hypothetical protein n=1 Tax=unclassified Hahella TaxID=2624107 RepID=UPI0024422452|nr:hypothetical protein [Hahella sp. CR1]MDG9670617.1 hypothetical protein [Hahella sp. CR1]
MNKALATFVLALFLSACSGVTLVSDYDEVIDKGSMEFSEQLNTHVKNMADLAGTPEGTYEKNRPAYNALESKLDAMIARASAASEGKACKLEKKLYKRVTTMMNEKIPTEIAQSGMEADGNADGCNEKLLSLVKDQLLFIEEIHRESDKCGPQKLSCLRPATSKSAMAIANQSINAVSVVENAKKN